MLEPDRDQIEQFVDAIFRYAGTQGFVSLRSFFEGDDTKPARINGTSLAGGLRHLIDVAEDDARRACQHPRASCLAPPIAVFGAKDRAREQDLVLGPVLSVEIDEHPREALGQLEAVLGVPTCVVKSGGRWINCGGEPEDKIHAHWRLPSRRPARISPSSSKLEISLLAWLAVIRATFRPCTACDGPALGTKRPSPGFVRSRILTPIASSSSTLRSPPSCRRRHNLRPKPSGADSGNPEDWPALIGNIISGRSYHHSLVSLSARLVGSSMHDGSAVTLLRALMLASRAEHDPVRWQARFDKIPNIVRTAREKFAKPGNVISLPFISTAGWDIRPAPPRPWAVPDLHPAAATDAVFRTGRIRKNHHRAPALRRSCSRPAMARAAARAGWRHLSRR